MLEDVQTRRDFQESLLAWFKTSQRSFLPWRSTTDPYEILVAEKLLQQTSARQLVIDVYNELMRDYPTPHALSKADVSLLKKRLHPLGFMYRAHELKKMAQELVDTHGGEVPGVLEELLALTGVGQYCARAVLSFSFMQDVAVVDTNVARFLHRVLGLSEPIPSSPSSNKRLLELATSLLPASNSRDYNLAILDLCASICTRRNPKCTECPILQYCTYGRASQTSVLESDGT